MVRLGRYFLLVPLVRGVWHETPLFWSLCSRNRRCHRNFAGRNRINEGKFVGWDGQKLGRLSVRPGSRVGAPFNDSTILADFRSAEIGRDWKKSMSVVFFRRLPFKTISY